MAHNLILTKFMPYSFSIPHVPQSRALNLSFNFPSTITAKELTECLTKGENFTLDVSYNYLTPEQVSMIVSSINNSNTVSSLIASCIFKSSKSVEELSKILTENSPLKALDLQANSINRAGAEFLAQNLPKAKALENLNLSTNNIDLEGGVKILQALLLLNHLKILNLSHNVLAAEAAEHIARLLGKDSTLEELYLLSAKLSSGGVKVLQALHCNSTLSILDLAHNNLRDDAGEMLAEVLKTNKTLSRLSIRNNQFSGDVLQKIFEALKVNNSVNILFIGGEKHDFHSGAFTALYEMVENNKTLQRLSLSAVSVQENGTKLSLSLRKNSTLETIDLSFAGIKDEAATILVYSMLEGSKLRFNISDNPISEELQKIIDILTLREVKHPDHNFFNFLFSNKKNQKSKEKREKAEEELKVLVKKLPFDLTQELQIGNEDHIPHFTDEEPFMEGHPLLSFTDTLGAKAYSTFTE